MGRKSSPEPSDKQMEVLWLIVAHVSIFGYQPSQDFMGKFLGLSKNAIFNRLKGLEARGYIERKDLQERAVMLKTIRFMPYQSFDKKPTNQQFEEMFLRLSGKGVQTKEEAEKEIASEQ